jgi:hypothetical protein
VLWFVKINTRSAKREQDRDIIIDGRFKERMLAMLVAKEALIVLLSLTAVAPFFCGEARRKPSSLRHVITTWNADLVAGG